MNGDDRADRVFSAIGESVEKGDRNMAALKARLSPILGLFDGLQKRLKDSGHTFEIAKMDEQMFMGVTYMVTYYARNFKSEALSFQISSGPPFSGGDKIVHTVGGLDQAGMRAVLEHSGQPDKVASVDVYGVHAARDVTFSSPETVDVAASQIERMLVAYFH